MTNNRPPEYYPGFLEGLALQMQLPESHWLFDGEDVRELKEAADLLKQLLRM
jgi:hypothetical protein